MKFRQVSTKEYIRDDINGTLPYYAFVCIQDSFGHLLHESSYNSSLRRLKQLLKTKGQIVYFNNLKIRT